MNTIRYSILQTGSYFGISAIMGFTSFYLLSYGCSNSTIGILLAVAGLVSALLQVKGGALIDRSRRIDLRQFLLLLSALLAIGAILLLTGISNTVAVSLIFLFLMILIYSFTPFVNALAMYFTNRGYRINFGLARGLGSLAYALAAVIIGYFADDRWIGPSFVPITVIFSCGIMILVLLSLRMGRPAFQQPAGLAEENPSISEFIRKYPRFVLLIIGITLLFITHNLLGSYAIQIITPLEGGSTATGIIAGISAASEVPVMCLFSFLLKRHSPGSLIRFSAVFFTLRAILLTLAFCLGSLPLYYVLCASQMFGYAIFIPASVYYANEVIGEAYLTLGQSFMAITNTIGIVISGLAGGLLLDLTGVLPTLITGIVISLAGTVSVLLLVQRKKK